MRKLFRIVLISGLVLFVCQAFAQSPGLRIIDNHTGNPVAFAHIKVTETGSKTPRYFASDIDGFVNATISKPSIVQVTYVGYQKYNDTLQPAKDLVIRLLPEVFSLDEVVVTAQYNPVSTDRSLYKVNVINQLQMRRSAATNLTMVLRNQMNVRFTQDASLGTGMSLQGLGGEHVKILVDGVPVIGRLNGSIDLSQINVQNVKQVEVIEGPMSVIYGSNAMAGVINIITADIPDNSYTASVGTYLESVGIIDFNGNFSVRKGKNAFGLEAARKFSSGYSPVDDGRIDLWKPRRQLNVDAKHSLTLKKVNFKNKVSYFDELLLIRGELLPPYYEKAFDNYFGTKRFTASSDYATKGINALTGNNSLSFYGRMRTLYYNDLTIPEKTPVEYDTTGFGSFLSRAMYSFRNKSGKFGSQIGYDANIEWSTGDRTGNEKHSIADVAGFATMQYQPVDWLSFQPGFRFIWNSQFKAPLIYAFHIKAGPYKGMIFRTSLSRGFRAPSLKELYLYFVDVNHDITGNPDLKAESSINLQVQASHRIEKVRYATETEIRFFLNDLKDEITLAETGEASYTYYNLDHSRTMGYSASIRSSLYPMLDLRLGWGSTGKSNYLDGLTSTKLYWSPEVTAEVSCRIEKPDLHFSAMYKYTGKTTKLYIRDGQPYEGYLDAYHNLDLTVLKTFMQKRFSVNIGVRNLFDVTNITSIGSSGEVHSDGSGTIPIASGRTYFVQLSYSIYKK